MYEYYINFYVCLINSVINRENIFCFDIFHIKNTNISNIVLILIYLIFNIYSVFKRAKIYILKVWILKDICEMEVNF